MIASLALPRHLIPGRRSSDGDSVTPFARAFTMRAGSCAFLTLLGFPPSVCWSRASFSSTSCSRTTPPGATPPVPPPADARSSSMSHTTSLRPRTNLTMVPSVTTPSSTRPPSWTDSSRATSSFTYPVMLSLNTTAPGAMRPSCVSSRMVRPSACSYSIIGFASTMMLRSKNASRTASSMARGAYTRGTSFSSPLSDMAMKECVEGSITTSCVACREQRCNSYRIANFSP